MEKIELSQDNIKLRWVATIIFFVVGAASLAYGINAMISSQTGWKEIEISSSYGETCADEFVLMYNLGAGEVSATAENKALTALYTEVAESAYKLFHSSLAFEGIQNVSYINQHPNEIVTVDPALYEAFSLLKQYGIRTQYLGPAYEIYNGIFICREDYEAVDYDPYRNPELRSFFAEIAAYGGDPDAVELELLEDNRVRLNVSEEYLRFATENGTTRFIDFYWMKNAFIADFLAEKLIDSGYTLGVISSYDGFIRNLDETGSADFYMNLFDKQGQTVYPAAVMQYSGPISMVCLQSYPASSIDLQRFYTLENGEIRAKYLDVADGLPKAAAGNLVSYSKSSGCAEVLLRVLPSYVGDQFEEKTVIELAEEGIDSVYCRDGVIYHTSEELRLTDFYQSDEVTCTAQRVK